MTARVLLPELWRSLWLERVGWTLLHFLWQEALLALALAVLLAGMRRRSAQARYLASLAAVAVSVLLPLATFVALPLVAAKPESSATQPERVQAPPHRPALALPAVVTVPAAMQYPSPTRSASRSQALSPGEKSPWRKARRAYRALVAKARPLLPWCATVWALGVALLSLRLLAGWTQLRRLCREGIRPADPLWQARLEALAAKMGIHRTVRLVESTLAEVPAVVGWLRPIIFLPLGALIGLSAAQTEMILAHELAHVARQDYLVNLGLTLFETLGFYHPAVWWVVGRVRLERENACDDLAVAATGEDLLGYARALARLEEMRAFSSGLALAATSGGRGILLARVRRLLGAAPKPVTGRATWWLAGGIALVIACGLTLGGLQRQVHAQDVSGKQPTPPILLRGRVVDENGRPVGGALVYDTTGHANPFASGLQEPTLTDANGFFLVPKLRHDDAWRMLGARLGNAAMGWLEIGAQGAPSALDEKGDIAKPIVLRPRRFRLSGICVDEQGQPLAGATVAVTSLPADPGGFTLTPGRPEETISLFWQALATESNAAGAFSLQMPAEDGLSVEISAPGRETVSPFETVAAGQHEAGDLGRITLAAAGSIAGRVAFAEGGGGKRSLKGMIFDAVEAGELQKAASAGPAGWFGPPEHDNIDSPSDSVGHYRLEHLPPGTYTVVLGGIDGAAYTETPTVVPAVENVVVRAGETASLDLRAVAGQLLRVQAFDSATGQPIRNRPFVHFEGPSRPRSAGLDYSTALTETGEWRFEVAPGHYRVFLTGAISTGSTELASADVDVTAGQDPPPVRLQVKERAPFSLSGHIQDAQGRPVPLVAGAIIQLLGSGPDKGRTMAGSQSSNGTFLIEYKQPGTHVHLLADVPGFRPWLSPEFILTDKPVPMTVALQECPMLSVQGQVLDQDGKPIARANVLGTIITADGTAYTVRLGSGDDGDELFTAADGRFETHRFRAGDKFRLDAFAGSQEVSASANWVPVEKGQVFHIQMNAITLPRVSGSDAPIGPRDLAGHVVDGQGKPVAGAKVTVAGSDPDLAPVLTNAAGGFRFPDFGDRHYVYLSVETAGFGTRWLTDLSVGHDFTVHLEDKTRLRGVLVKPDGSPAGRAIIVLRKNKPTQRPAMANLISGLRLQRVTDERGTYDFPLEPGEYVAEITSADGDLVARDEGVQVAEGQSTALPPTLDAGLTLRVQTVDSVTGKPAPGVKFYIRDWTDAYAIGPWPGSERQSDAQGFVQWEHLFPGRTVLEADRTGMYARFWSTDDRETFHLNAPKGRPPVGNECADGSLFMNPVPGRAAEPIIVQTERAVKISGQVLDPDGKPAINVQVRAITFQPDQKPAGDEPGGDLPPFSAYTQDSFFSGYLPAGNGELTRMNGFPQSDSLASGVSEPFASAPGDTRQAVIRLTKGGWIEGRVVDAQDKPLGGVNVVATAQDHLDSYVFRPWTKTGPHGEFHFGPLRPAEYQVRPTTIEQFAAGNEPPQELRLVTVVAGEHVQTGALHYGDAGWTAPAPTPAPLPGAGSAWRLVPASASPSPGTIAQAASSPTPAAVDVAERHATFMATATIEFQMPPWAIGHEPTASLDEELNAIKANLSHDDTATIVKRLADTSVFQVTACGPTPDSAADRANEIVRSLQQHINGPGSKLPPCLIMIKALAAEAAGLFEIHGVATAQDNTARKYVLTRRDDKTETLYLEPAVLLDSSALQFAALAPERGGDQIMDFFLTKAGAQRFEEITIQHLNKRIAFVSGNQLLCAPVIKDPIYSRSLEVSGSITGPEASNLVALFNANLKAPVPDPSPSPAPPAPPPTALTAAGGPLHGPISAEMLTVRVKVVDESGEPVKGAKVTPMGLYSRSLPTAHFGWFAQGVETPPSVLTDSEGVAAMPYPRLTDGKLETDAVSFRVEHANFSAANAMDYSVQSDPAQSKPLVLRRGATLRVTGHLAGSQETVPVYPQSADPSDLWLSAAAWQDVGDNALANSQIHAGKTYLRLAHAASDGTLFFSDTILLSVAAGETQARTLELKPAVRVEGRLDDAVPRPVRHGRVVVHVYPTGPDAGAQWLGWDSWREVAADGTFAFAGLPPGTLEVTAVCDGFISTSSPDPAGITYLRSVGPQRFSLPPDQTTRVTVQMSKGAACEVELRDAAGAPVSGGTVTFNPNVHWTPGLTGYFCAGQLKMEDQLSRWREIDYDRGQQDSRFSAVSDARGIATVRSLPPGQQLTFSVTDDRYQMPKSTAAGMINEREAAVDLRAGETQHVTVQLEKKRALVEETIGQDSDNASVQRNAPAAADGHVTFMASANVLVLSRNSGVFDAAGEAFLKAHLAKVDSSATVKALPQGLLFQVSACGATPTEAASRTNQIVGSLHDQFSGSKPDEPIVGVTDPATASQAVNVFELHPLVTSPAKSAEKYLLTKPDGSMEDVFLDPAVLLDSSAVQTTTLTHDVEGRPQIAIYLTAEGATRFAGITARYLHQRIGLVAAGQVFCAPVIGAKISSGDLKISGNFSEQEACEFVALLNENAKPPANRNSSPAQTQLPPTANSTGDNPDAKLLSGKVVDGQGNPVPGAEVFDYYQTGNPPAAPVLTDASGNFHLELDERHGINSRLIARLGERALGWTSSPTPASPKIVLRPCSAKLDGNFTDAAGHPQAGVRVRVNALDDGASNHLGEILYPTPSTERLWGMLSTTSDAQGHFELLLPEKVNCHFEISAPDWVTQRWYETPADGHFGRIVLEPGGSIAGHVSRLADGAPQAGSSVLVSTIADAEGNGSLVGSGSTDAKGAYVVHGLQAGEYTVTVGHPGGAQQPVAVAVEHISVRAGETTPDVDLHVLEGRAITVEVVDRVTGQPRPQAKVSCYGPSDPSSSAVSIDDLDKQGRHTFVVAPGSYVCAVVSPAGNKRSEQSVEVSPDSSVLVPIVKLRVSIDSQVRGVVRLKSGEPVPRGTSVELVSPPNMPSVSGYSFSDEHEGNDLTYTFDGLPAGSRVSVAVDSAGCRVWQSVEFAVGTVQPELTAVLEPAVVAPVRGQVIDASGKPVAGAVVRALISTPPGRHGSLPLGEDGAQLRTDARGRFETSRLRVGDTFSVWVHDGRDESGSPPNLTRDEVKRQASSAALAIAGAGGLDVPALTLQSVGAPSANADLQTGSQLRLRGVLRSKDGQLVPGNVTIQLEQRSAVGSRFSYTITHHSIGNDLAYTLEGTTDASRASLLVDAPGFRTWQSADFAVTVGMPPMDAELDPAVPAPVRGRVVDDAGKPVAGAKISATVIAPGGGQCGLQLAPDGTVLTTDAQGRFETSRLRVGDTFNLWANDLDFKTPPPANPSPPDFICESRSETLTIADASGLDVPDMVLQPSRRLQPDKHSGMPGDPFKAQDKQEQLQALAALRDVDDFRAKHMIMIAFLASRQAPFTPADRAVIARFLDSNNPEVLFEAARRLQRMNDPAVLAKLAALLPRMLDQPNEAIDLAVWLRRGSVPGASDRAFELFAAWLRDPATPLGPRHVLSFRLPEAVSPKKYASLYVDLLADADTTVSYNTLGRLEELTDDQSFGFDPARAPAERSAALARWREWLAQSIGSLPEDTPTEKPAASKAPTWIGARILADPKAETGIWITTLVPGSPAEKAGLRPGDIITAVDGRTLAGRSADQVAVHELQGEAGKPLRLTVHRQDIARPQEIAVVPEPRPASQP